MCVLISVQNNLPIDQGFARVFLSHGFPTMHSSYLLTATLSMIQLLNAASIIDLPPEIIHTIATQLYNPHLRDFKHVRSFMKSNRKIYKSVEPIKGLYERRITIAVQEYLNEGTEEALKFIKQNGKQLTGLGSLNVNLILERTQIDDVSLNAKRRNEGHRATRDTDSEEDDDEDQFTYMDEEWISEHTRKFRELKAERHLRFYRMLEYLPNIRNLVYPQSCYDEDSPIGIDLSHLHSLKELVIQFQGHSSIRFRLPAHLERLKIDCVNFRWLDTNVASLRELRSLEVYTLLDSTSARLDLADLISLEKIDFLKASKRRIQIAFTDEDLQKMQLQQLPNLRHLNFQKHYFAGSFPLSLLNSLAKLTGLDTHSILYRYNLQKLPNLHTLRLSGSYLEADYPNAFLQPFPFINYLLIYGSYVSVTSSRVSLAFLFGFLFQLY